MTQSADHDVDHDADSWDDDFTTGFADELEDVVLDGAALAGMTGPEAFTNTCAKCHGDKAQGNEELGAPSIAGLPFWYVMEQIEKFKTGRRGYTPADAQGSLMQVVAKSIETPVFRKTASHIASLRPVKIARDTQGDVERGKELYESQCMACHRYNGSGEIVFKSPPLTILSAWYLKAQMLKFSSGIRGSYPNDVEGEKMITAMSTIESEQDIDNLVAYIALIAHKRWPTLRRGGPRQD